MPAEPTTVAPHPDPPLADERDGLTVRAVLNSLLAHAPVAAAVVGTDGRVLHHNDALAALAEGAEINDTGRARTRLASSSSSSSDIDARHPTLASLIPGVADSLAPMVAGVLTSGGAVPTGEVRTGEPGRRRYWQVNAFPIRRSDGLLFGVGLIFVETTDETLAARRQKESLARLDLSLGAGGLGTWDWDLITGRVLWSAGMEAISGLTPGSFGGTAAAVVAAVPEADREQMETRLRDAARSGSDYEDEFRMQRPNGDIRWVESRGRVVATRNGIPLRMIGVASDVTERHVTEDVKLKLLEREHQARLSAEASRERLALLAEVSGVLAATLDPQEVYENLAALLVPRLADWCVLDSLDEDGSLRETAIVHIDPRQVTKAREMRDRRRQAGGDGIWSVRRAMRTGRSERVEDITDADLADAAVDDTHLSLLRDLAPRSAIVAPLVARGRVLGGITVVTTGARSYESDDQALVENIAARAATAIDTAMLFDSRTEVARALQQTLLPPALPEIPGIDLGARYRVADVGIEIGGDFYDVFETKAGWHVVLGDVCGKGPSAAAVTGLFRHTLRAVAPGLAVADVDNGPAAILAATNDAILGQIDDARFATAVLVNLKPGRGRAKLCVSCGGHPRPILVRADGTVERVEASGTLLGVLPDPQLQEVSIELGPGDVVVLYTDGVTEARHGPEQFGEHRLREALAGAQTLTSAVDVADRVVTAVDDFRDPDAPADDIAVVAIRVPSLHDL